MNLQEIKEAIEKLNNQTKYTATELDEAMQILIDTCQKVVDGQNKISKEEITKIITQSTLWNLGADSHNALSELVESIYNLIEEM